MPVLAPVSRKSAKGLGRRSHSPHRHKGHQTRGGDGESAAVCRTNSELSGVDAGHPESCEQSFAYMATSQGRLKSFPIGFETTPR